MYRMIKELGKLHQASGLQEIPCGGKLSLPPEEAHGNLLVGTFLIPLLKPLRSLPRRGFAFEGFDLGFKLLDPLREVPDEGRSAVRAHAGAEHLPATNSNTPVRRFRPAHTTAATGHDIAADVGFLDRYVLAPAVWAGVQPHLGHLM